MGMDYKYAGSASYPRFDRELCLVAEIFGGVKTEYLKEREATENERPLGYWFGFLSSSDPNSLRFIFPDGTNEILVKWFNNIYDYFTAKETEIVWEHIKEHPEIREISIQIWSELEDLVDCGDSWYIS